MGRRSDHTLMRGRWAPEGPRRLTLLEVELKRSWRVDAARAARAAKIAGKQTGPGVCTSEACHHATLGLGVHGGCTGNGA
jgi:hypothetical protein